MKHYSEHFLSLMAQQSNRATEQQSNRATEQQSNNLIVKIENNFYFTFFLF